MAASTITRDTWTNDTGSAATPAADGTIINNNALQNNIYARIDEMFSGAGSYATLTLGGKLAAEGFGAHSFSAGGTGPQSLTIRNTTAGTTNSATVRVGNDTSATLLNLEAYASTFTPGTYNVANGAAVFSTGVGGLSLMASDAAGVIRFLTGGTTERARLTAAGMLLVGDTSNANMTVGLTLNQGAADDEIIALKSTDVAHGVTGLYETDTFATFQKASSVSGGLQMTGISSSNIAVNIFGVVTTEITTKASSSAGAINLFGFTKSGTSAAGMGANANIVVVSSASGAARFILDADGDSHQDVGTAWTNFDDYEDHELLSALSAGVSRADDPLREAFGGLLEKYRSILEQSRIVTFNEDGHHFVNWSRLNMLKVGAIRQNALRIAAQAREIADLKSRLLALEA